MNDSLMICIAGKGEIAVRGLELAIDAVGNANVRACVNNSDNGNTTWQPSLLRFARELGVQTARLDELYTIPNLLFLSLEFDQIICPSKFCTKRLYNVHFSLLPAYKGMYTAIWPLLNQETLGGVTLHEIDSGIDTGNIIDQRKFSIDRDFTAAKLYRMNMKAGVQLVEETFDQLIEGAPTSKPQPAIGSSYYSKESIKFGDLRFNFRQSAEQIRTWHRSFYFPEYQVPTYLDSPISQVEITDTRSNARPGTLVNNTEHRWEVSTIDFNVILYSDCFERFFRATEQCDIADLKSIPELKSYLNRTNKNGHTAIMIAAYNGFTELFLYLVNEGADVNATNPNGTSVLMYAKESALRTGNFQIVEHLLEMGSDVNHRDRFGKSVLEYLSDECPCTNSLRSLLYQCSLSNR